MRRARPRRHCRPEPRAGERFPAVRRGYIGFVRGGSQIGRRRKGIGTGFISHGIRTTMNAIRHLVAAAATVALTCFGAIGGAAAEPGAADPREVVRAWYDMALALTRHTATFTPPVASRAYAYIGVTAFEAVASGSDKLHTLAGQLNGFSDVAASRDAAPSYDDAVVLEAALSAVVHDLFGNTGPTGHRAMDALDAKLRSRLADGPPAWTSPRGARPTARRSRRTSSTGPRTMAARRSTNMGFPLDYKLTSGTRPLGADQCDRAAAGAAPARVGPEPHLRDAEGRDLRSAGAAGLQRGQELRISTSRRSRSTRTGRP